MYTINPNPTGRTYGTIVRAERAVIKAGRICEIYDAQGQLVASYSPRCGFTYTGQEA